MFDRNELNQVFRKFEAAKLHAVIGSNALTDPETARKFVTALRQSGYLPIQIENADSERKRDGLVEESRKLLAHCPETEVRDDFENHVSDAKIVERGYREIFKTMQGSEIWKQPPAVQAWGMIFRAEREFQYVQQEIEKELLKCGAQQYPSLDPLELRIYSEDGEPHRPDAVINGIVRNLGDTLETLGHVHNWYDRGTGALVLPPEVKCDDTISFQAGMFSLVASQWRSLLQSWDRSRLFDARFRLREQDFPIKEGGTRQCTVLEVQSPSIAELRDRIALYRLEQVFFDAQREVDQKTGNKTARVASTSAIPLAPNGYISPEEQVAAEVLDGNYFLPVYDDSATVADLPLKAWLRGYAYYTSIAKGDEQSPILSCIRFSESELIAKLVSAGLSEQQAYTFVGHTIFGRGVADLFDAPLLKIGDGRYCFFTPALHTATLGVILLSRLSSLNRRRDSNGEIANDCQIEDKGKLFESRVLRLFTNAGIPAQTFKYSLDGGSYECDVAALIENTLFVFECKNRSLPMGHIPSLYYFTTALQDAKDQALRIAKQLNENPDIVRNQFGPNTKWSRIVPVVLYALPWSFGKSDEVYVYDASALAHLMLEGFTSVVAESRIDQNRILRRHRYLLRKGATPTTAELEREMGNPHQLRLNALGWEATARPVQVSDTMVFSLPEWTHRSSTLEEKLIALGSKPEEAARIASEMNSDFPAGVERLRQKVKRGAANRKLGRNDPCSCGSGKKYKKCCLDEGRQGA